MKGLLIAIGLVLICAVLGWITFDDSGPTATITIDKEEIKQDAQEAADKARDFAGRAVDATQEAVGDAETEIDDDAPVDPDAVRNADEQKSRETSRDSRNNTSQTPP